MLGRYRHVWFAVCRAIYDLVQAAYNPFSGPREVHVNAQPLSIEVI